MKKCRFPSLLAAVILLAALFLPMSAAAVEDMKSIIGVKDSSATATTPMPTNRANSRLRMPRMSPNTPRNGADSATMAMAMEVA